LLFFGDLGKLLGILFGEGNALVTWIVLLAVLISMLGVPPLDPDSIWLFLCTFSLTGWFYGTIRCNDRFVGSSLRF
jgi:hypothetical protein